MTKPTVEPAVVEEDAAEDVASASGLDGVVVARTRLSEVDGDKGLLRVGGYDVERWATEVTFEQAAAQLLAAGRDEEVDAAALQVRLAAARAEAFERLGRCGDALEAADGMEALRAGLAHLRSSGNDFDDAVRAIGAAGVIAAAWTRRRSGGELIAPSGGGSSSGDGHAAEVLRMATGSAARGKALEAYLVTVMDHGMNASTFAARVIASTGSDLISALVGGVGALKGPLHGGAPGPVLEMLDQIGRPEEALGWLTRELDSGRRIMGMGHRIYRVRDPRAAVLEKVARGFEATGGSRLALAQAVEVAAAKLLRERKPDRPLQANVEFYTAVVLDAVGLPAAAFAPAFAVGRVVGWAAHVLEQRRVGRLIRPDSVYVGARY